MPVSATIASAERCPECTCDRCHGKGTTTIKRHDLQLPGDVSEGYAKKSHKPAWGVVTKIRTDPISFDILFDELEVCVQPGCNRPRNKRWQNYCNRVVNGTREAKKYRYGPVGGWADEWLGGKKQTHVPYDWIVEMGEQKLSAPAPSPSPSSSSASS